MRDFYATMAQVFPVLMLAIVWESAYLDRLRSKPRRTRREDPASGVRFWTKRRVRNWTITLVAVTVAEIALITLLLANVVPDAPAYRWVVIGGLTIVLGTILTRAVADILDATREG